MWQVLKAVTILFTICPILKLKKIVYFIFLGRKKIFIFSLEFSQGEKQFCSHIFFSLGI